MASLADIKAESRRSLHKRMAVPAIYYDPFTELPRPVTVRYHNRMQGALSIVDGGAGVLEGIEKLVFNASELAAPSDGLTPIVLMRGGEVEIPKFSNEGTLVVTLDSEGASDGPENIYWSVTTNRA